MSKKNSKKHKTNQNSYQNKNRVNLSPTQGSSSKPKILPQTLLTAKIKMLTDWHIGSGTGRTGDIDSLVQRDKNGFPYIPAKTITGMWRDACEIIALALDNDGTKESNNIEDKGTWQKWVDYLFGEQPSLAKEAMETSPLPAALSIRSAHLGEELSKALKNKTQLHEALTFVKPGIQIEADSGCAKKDFLRFEEMVRGGTTLETKCELNLPEGENQKFAAYALLIAGTRLVERLGGKRRRGAGKCRLEVNDVNYWIDWLVANQEAPSLPEPSKEDSSVNNTVSIEQTQVTSVDSNWVHVKLQIQTLSPLIISKRTVGNITETLNYIPGTHLLRLILRKLAPTKCNLGSAIACGDILVTNATLEINGQQGRHVPLALFYEKLGGGIEKGCPIYNILAGFPRGDNQMKGYRTGYIGSTNISHLPEYAKVNLTVGTHNTIKDEYQRPTSDLGGVYSYQAIQPGTLLQAELRLRKSLADAFSKYKKDWHTLFNGKDRLGQSKKDDYGAIEIKVLNFEQKQEQKQEQKKQESLVVWLLSDVLVRDERLRPSTSIEDLKRELEAHLEVDLEIPETCQQENKKLSLIARQNRLESWQVRWGLPRPSLVGIAAGTCITFKITGNKELEASKLIEVESSGIGERRAEGYGQICFNDPILTINTSQLKSNTGENSNQSSKNNLSTQLIVPNSQSFSYAHIIEKAAWRKAINKAVLEITAIPNNPLNIYQNQPTMSQLGALRAVIGQIQEPESASKPGIVTRWLNNLEATPNRKDKWSSQTLQEIRTLINNENRIWNVLKINVASITLTSNGESYLKNALWSEAINNFIDACIRSYKRSIENNSNTNNL